MTTKRCIGYTPLGVDPHETAKENFGVHRRMRDGLQPQCKSCQSLMNSSSPMKKRHNDQTNGLKGSTLREIEDNTLGYYVYFHRDPDGSVVYIGKGRGDRAFTLRGRSPAHAQMICTAMTEHRLWVEFQDMNMSESDALWLEGQLILEYQPIYNKIGKDKR